VGKLGVRWRAAYSHVSRALSKTPDSSQVLTGPFTAGQIIG
jgi:hypothetical protein